MNQAQRTIKILVIRQGDQARSPVEEWLGPCVDVSTVDSLGEMQNTLARTEFDYVLTTPGIIKASAGGSSLSSESFNSEQAGDSVGIYDRDGHLVWANPVFMTYTQTLRDMIRAACGDAFSTLTAAVESDEPDRPCVHRAQLGAPGAAVYAITATPITDFDHGMTQVVVVVQDISHAAERRKQLAAIEKAGRELARMDTEQIARLNTQERLGLLEQKIIRSLHDLMRFDNFSIHLIDKKTNKLELVLSTGMPKSVQNIDLYALPDGNGIAGYVAYHGRCYNCPDVSKDPHYFQGMEGARSSLTVPLRLNDEVIGILNVESNEPAAFDSERGEMAELLGRDIATALHILDLLVTERYTTTGQLGSDVMAEVTEPINDIMTDIETLTEDYIGHDDLRHRLNKISGNAVSVRDSIKRVTSPKRGLIGHRATGVKRSDPILSGKKLLIADDEPLIRETVRDVLASYGCEITIVENGEEAVRRISESKFDLVLSDIRMPGKSGYDVFAAAKEADPKTPVILMTGFGYDPNHSIVRARREGLAAVLFKPFKVDQLLGEIRAALHAVPV